MKDAQQVGADEAVVAWAKGLLDTAVTEIGAKGVLRTKKVEARVVWMLPRQFLIGQAREEGRKDDFTWVIAGRLPTDYLASTAAGTSREAARRFALKWQLESARIQRLLSRREPGSDTGTEMEATCKRLAEQAEALYVLADQEAVWEAWNRPE